MVCNITQDIIYHLLCIWYDTSSNGIVDLSISSLSKRSIGLTSRLLIQNISYASGAFATYISFYNHLNARMPEADVLALAG